MAAGGIVQLHLTAVQAGDSRRAPHHFRDLFKVLDVLPEEVSVLVHFIGWEQVSELTPERLLGLYPEDGLRRPVVSTHHTIHAEGDDAFCSMLDDVGELLLAGALLCLRLQLQAFVARSQPAVVQQPAQHQCEQGQGSAQGRHPASGELLLRRAHLHAQREIVRVREMREPAVGFAGSVAQALIEVRSDQNGRVRVCQPPRFVLDLHALFTAHHFCALVCIDTVATGVDGAQPGQFCAQSLGTDDRDGAQIGMFRQCVPDHEVLVSARVGCLAGLGRPKAHTVIRPGNPGAAVIRGGVRVQAEGGHVQVQVSGRGRRHDPPALIQDSQLQHQRLIAQLGAQRVVQQLDLPDRQCAHERVQLLEQLLYDHHRAIQRLRHDPGGHSQFFAFFLINRFAHLHGMQRGRDDQRQGA